MTYRKYIFLRISKFKIFDIIIIFLCVCSVIALDNVRVCIVSFYIIIHFNGLKKMFNFE